MTLLDLLLLWTATSILSGPVIGKCIQVMGEG